MSMKSFYAQNAKSVEPESVVVSERFCDEEGNPEKWIISAISAKVEDELVKKATNKKGIRDEMKFVSMMAAKSVQYPDLNDAELQQTYGVNTPDELMLTMLTGGERAVLYQAVTRINGYDKSVDELIDEAKN